ncbi:porin family protein [Flavobacterium macacae]|uniref:PorT family protein n=1 Tax=Flavobacterium macacae TaxID=2488993 RepID=A0A3P3WHU5_9FLAO|nr:porin family protein [Flavobacterium macacae]RRJ93896.1 PorT family protein [Flavobacterium macacae]
MKKYLVILLISTASFAQNKPKFGVNLGGTFSNIRGNEIADTNKYNANFLVGASFELPLNERFSLLTNVNYERKSFKNNVTVYAGDPFDPVITTRNIDVEARLEYITIPVNLKYYIDANKKFYVNGGAFVGIFLDSNTKGDGENSNNDENYLFKTLDFGANLGIGTNFKINDKNSLNLEIRHNYGLANISKVQVYNDDKVKTNSFNLIANWQFDL